MAVSIRDTGVKDKLNLVLLRAEKLTAALYLVTDFLSDREPVKWKLRERALGLVSDIAIFAHESGIRKIDQLVSLIDVVINGNLASRMNFAILKREHQNLRNTLLDFLPEQVEGLQDLPAPTGIPAVTTAAVSVKPQTKPRIENNGRKEAILAYIRQKGPVSIAEVTQTVPGVSTKTVQRELNALIQIGKLRKEGDRRWSRYMLT